MATSLFATWQGGAFRDERTAHGPYVGLSAANTNDAVVASVARLGARAGQSPYRAAGLYESRGVAWPAWTAAVAVHVILALIAVEMGWTSLPPLPALPETIAVVFERAPAPAVEPAQPEAPPQASAPAPQETASAQPQAPTHVTPAEPAPSAVAVLPLPPPARPYQEIAVAPAPKPAAAPAPARLAALPVESAPTSAAVAPASAALAPVIPPRPASGLAGNRKPVYPLVARSRHLEGRVMLQVQVAASGDPLAVRVISSSGHPLLDDSAVEAVRTWRFVPATQAGQAVAAPVEVPVDFRMAD
jgi:protein TonB